ncbi:SCP2 sterol-binding domain-containing protein [Pisolithus orientalis]|uniref:SCP2 sterol-binding domain-containing protein n=1 Tax=Pisolithus orientalis TaxID=936130 RepID=UPI0022240DBB|nr:SCP2 sterol-binding domain-containing protein [Pisolithus orientalis]KAI5995808.1 SCP2 sterol-binding domain-containing protein [Pisolithus orientalis]
MSDIKVEGFKASEILSRLGTAFEGFTDAERKAQIKKANGIFELRITNGNKQEAVWTIDMKEKGTVYKGPAESKPGVVLSMSDDTFAQLANGKVRSTGQKAFMTGKLKTKGNAMLATKLTPILETAKGKAKL